MPNGIRIDPATKVQLGSQTWLTIVEELPRTLRVRARTRGERYKRFVEAVIWVAWVDEGWARLPPDCGNWRAVHARFVRWNRRNLWDVVALHIGDEASVHLLRLANESRRTHNRPRPPLKPVAQVAGAAVPLVTGLD